MSESALIKPVGITEIFSSLQGEGPHIGEPHIFLRFEECNIHCDYCDELGKPATALGLEDVYTTILELNRTHGPHCFVSLTGGEPLLYVTFLEALAPKLRADHFRIYLETSGILPKALERISKEVDVVAMDIKLRSVTKEPRNYFEEHRAFLKIARRTPEVFVKMIVSPEVDPEEFLLGVQIIEEQDPAIPLVLQGVTARHIDEKEQNETLRGLQQVALQFLRNVRIIPRLHIAMGIR